MARVAFWMVTIYCMASPLIGCSPSPDTNSGGGDAEAASSQPEDCANRHDDDEDGKADCLDPDCFGSLSCDNGPDGRVPLETCDNSLDDDGNGRIDCADLACTTHEQCRDDGESCDDGLDDDGDGQVDCADTDCAGHPRCPESSDAKCTNGFDDDGDGQTDCFDPDCDGRNCGHHCICAGGHRRELQCLDDIDNDRDGAIDCADDDCASEPTCVGTENCSNEVDDDRDRQVDCVDRSCAHSPQCRRLRDGAPCRSAEQCAGGHCADEGAGHPNGFCTNDQACTPGGNEGCNGGLCVPLQNGRMRCLPRCTGIGTGSASTERCRAGYVCIDAARLAGSSTLGANNVCVGFCNSDADCAGSGDGYGCNPASHRCEMKNKGLRPYGSPCTLDAECEGRICDRSRPGGYCMGYCSGTSLACGNGGACSYSSSTGDNVGLCFKTCRDAGECRPAPYACRPFGTQNLCQ